MHLYYVMTVRPQQRAHLGKTRVWGEKEKITPDNPTLQAHALVKAPN